MKYFTGIGSRQTPADVLELMTKTAIYLREEGYYLRSGHAAGADRAFELGAKENSIIYLPWEDFGQKPYKEDPGMEVLGHKVCNKQLWERYHRTYLQSRNIRSAYDKESFKMLHGRNVAQVIGTAQHIFDVLSVSKFVICYCEFKDGEPQGGTATAFKLAHALEIPIFNLWKKEDRERIEAKVLEGVPS